MTLLALTGTYLLAALSGLVVGYLWARRTFRRVPAHYRLGGRRPGPRGDEHDEVRVGHRADGCGRLQVPTDRGRRWTPCPVVAEMYLEGVGGRSRWSVPVRYR